METTTFEINQEKDLQIKSVNLEINTIQPQIVNVINPKPLFIPKPFIEANTSEISLEHLQNDCVIPVFSKDNERTIAHQEFIDIAQDCASRVFPHHQSIRM